MTSTTQPSTPAARPWVRAVRGAVSRLSHPLLPDDYLHLLNPLWSARELRGKVVEVRPETETAATLVIKPGWGWHGSYTAGQYVGIGHQVGGRWHWRSYSLTSTPVRDDGLIALTVKAMPEGFLSGHLVNGLAAGTIVRLAAPQGNFVLPDPPPAKTLFLTAGSGITPVMSMLRTLDARGTMGDVVLVHSAPTERDLDPQAQAVAERALDGAGVVGHLTGQDRDDLGDDGGHVRPQGARQLGRQVLPGGRRHAVHTRTTKDMGQSVCPSTWFVVQD